MSEYIHKSHNVSALLYHMDFVKKELMKDGGVY